MSAAVPPRLLFISNGHGEDTLAAAIVRRLPKGMIAEAYPTLGNGVAYRQLCAVVGPRAVLHSEGWRNVRFSLARDVSNGGLATVWPGLKFLRSTSGHYDRVVVVGDLVGVLGCRVSGIRGITYVDVYKTGAGRLYSALEIRLIKAVCSTVFCRAEGLAEQLRQAGIDARCAGNLMMDAVPFTPYTPQSRRASPHAVTLLPGSRKLTVESFGLQVEALRRLHADAMPDVFLAVADAEMLERLASATGLKRSGPLTSEAGDLGELSDRRLTIHASRGALGHLLAVSDLVLTQAGTASVQAMGAGVPAITFRNGRDRGSRFRAETALFGDARLVVPPDPVAIADAVAQWLADPAERHRRGTIGRQKLGQAGALEAIIAHLTPAASG